MPIPSDQLKADLKGIDNLVEEGTITQEKADVWKSRIISKFEKDAIPPEPEKSREMPGDLAHLPGRMVGGLISAVKKMPNIGANVIELDRQMSQGYGKKRDPDELLKDAGKFNK